MISKKNNYNYLLDSLRDMTIDYYIKRDNNLEVFANSTIMFSSIYCLAYRNMHGVVGEMDNKKKQEYTYYALNDYGTFNSFINNCVNEYRMYNDIGTGNVLYIPYQELADFFFNDVYYKSILKNYVITQLEDIINYNNEISNSK